MKEFLKRKDNFAEKCFGVCIICYLIYFITRSLFVFDTSLYWFGYYFEDECWGLIFPNFSLFYLLRNKQASKYIIIILGIVVLLSMFLQITEYGLEGIFVSYACLLVLVAFEAINVWNVKKVKLSKIITFICAIIMLLVCYYGYFGYYEASFVEKVVRYSAMISRCSFLIGLLIYHYDNYIDIRVMKNIEQKSALNKSKFDDITKLQRLGIISKQEAEQRKNALLTEITDTETLDNTEE